MENDYNIQENEKENHVKLGLDGLVDFLSVKIQRGDREVIYELFDPFGASQEDFHIMRDGSIGRDMEFRSRYSDQKHRKRSHRIEIENGRIISLYLEHSLIKIPESIGNLENLEYFDFRGSEFAQLPESIGNLENLSVLNLNWNRLTELPESIGNLQNLVHLYLDGGRFTQFPKSIGNLQNLRRLHAYSTQLTSLPESIGNLQNLELADFQSCKIRELPESIGNWDLSNFRLDFGGNPLTQKAKNLLEKIHITPGRY